MLAHLHISNAQVAPDEVIQDIRSAYERVDFDVAESRIKEALDNYEQFSPSELAQIYVFSALVNYAQNNRTEAQAQLGLAIQLNPEVEVDPILAPPGLVEMAARIKTLMAESGNELEEEPELRYLVLADPRPGAALRSMILPGWGQLYKGQKRKGYSLVGAWGLTAGGTLVAHILRASAENDYLDAATTDEALRLYDDFNRWHQVRNNLFLASAGIWVYSYIDALVFNAPQLENRRVNVYAYPGRSGPNMQIVVRF